MTDDELNDFIQRPRTANVEDVRALATELKVARRTLAAVRSAATAGGYLAILCADVLKILDSAKGGGDAKR